MFCYETSDSIQFMSRETVIAGQSRRFQPKLDDLPIPFDVDVRRFTAIGTEKDETIGSIYQDGRHDRCSRLAVIQ